MGTHVHVYRVTEMAEIDVRSGGKKALQEAVDVVTEDSECVMRPADCKFVAIVPKKGVWYKERS